MDGARRVIQCSAYLLHTRHVLTMMYMDKTCVSKLQGKYINDPDVLREAAEKAGVADADQVLSDPTVARDQASSFSAVTLFKSR